MTDPIIGEDGKPRYEYVGKAKLSTGRKIAQPKPDDEFRILYMNHLTPFFLEWQEKSTLKRHDVIVFVDFISNKAYFYNGREVTGGLREEIISIINSKKDQAMKSLPNEDVVNEISRAAKKKVDLEVMNNV